MQTAPRLILVTPEVAADGLVRDLGSALEGAEIAAVILRLPPSEDRALLARAKALVGIVQATGAAAMLQGATALVGRAGADGGHFVGDVEQLGEMVAQYHPGKMVGAGGLGSRHDCMLAGEAGVDYLLFGDGGTGTLEALLNRVSWWAEIFTSPCAALAPTFDSVPELARAGADFIALGDVIWSSPEGPREAVRRVSRSLEEVSA